MRSFEEWFNQYENKNEYAAERIAKDAYELGLQHRQTEVDDLQKRMEKALNLVGEMEEKRYPFSAYAKELKALLSGEAHE